MYVVYKTQAMVLGSYDVGEGDRHYVVFTKDFGKRLVEVRGARRSSSKLVGLLEYPAVLGISCIAVNDHLRLIDAMQIEVFKNGLGALDLSAFMCSVVNACTPWNVVDTGLWRLLRTALRFVSQSTALVDGGSDLFKKRFLSRFLSHSGISFSEYVSLK